MSRSVIYPHGGRHLLLQWWTHNEQWHLILASSLMGVGSVVKRACDLHSQDMRLGDFCEIDVVGPSEKMARDAAAFNRQEGIENFRDEVARRLQDALRLGYELPPGFKACEKYTPEDLDNLHIPWAMDHHQGCAHCHEGIRTELTPEALYDKYHDAWVEEHPPIKHKGKAPRVISRAQPAVDGEPLWYATPNFGHHASGVDLREVDYSLSDSPHRPEYLMDGVLFFFRRGSDLDKAPLQTMICTRKAKEKADRERRDTKFRADRKQESRHLAEKAIKALT